MAACGDDAATSGGDVIWERVLEVEHADSLDCWYLTVERESGSIAVLADAQLRSFDGLGRDRWARELTDCQQLWDDDPGIGTLRRRFDARGRELERYPSELGRIATRDSRGQPLALGDALVKFDRERRPLWEVRLILVLGTPRASSLVVDDEDAAIVSWAGSECPSSNVLRKYDSDGTLRWSTCLELGQARGLVPIATDGTDILIAGEQAADRPHDGGAREWILQRYDSDGELRWSRPIGSLITSRDGREDTHENALSAMAVDRGGNVFIVGRVLGRTPEVSHDVWVAKLDRDARVQWTTTIAGEPGLDDQGVAIALDDHERPIVLARLDHPAGDSLSKPPARVWLGKLAP